jgi:RNA polymerase sigma factor (sigma-70 family)
LPADQIEDELLPRMFLRRKTTDPLSDEDLVTRLKSGHQASLAVLWDRYAHLLFGVGMKYLQDTERAKDAVTELFGTLPALLVKHDVKAVRPWLHTVMRNRCLMLLRQRKPEQRFPELADQMEQRDEDTVLKEATLQRLEAAIGDLNAEQGTCIRLFYFERLSYQLTAERTGFSLEQVRSHLQNGRRNLRLLLTKPRTTGDPYHADPFAP